MATFWLGVWEIAARVVNRELYLPGPATVVRALWRLAPEPAFWAAVGATMGRVLAGLSLSVVLGMALGAWCARSAVAYDLLHPFVVTVRATPVISFIVIALVWLRSGLVPVLVCIVVCFPLVWTATVTALWARDPALLEMARAFRVPAIRVATALTWPSIRRQLLAAVVGALGLGWRVSVAAEVLSHPPASIGEGIDTAKAYLDSPVLFAWTLVVVLLSYAFEVVLGRLARPRTGARTPARAAVRS